LRVRIHLSLAPGENFKKEKKSFLFLWSTAVAHLVEEAIKYPMFGVRIHLSLAPGENVQKTFCFWSSTVAQLVEQAIKYPKFKD
jgi:hypothetical protein